MLNYLPKIRLFVCFALLAVAIGLVYKNDDIFESSYVSLSDDNCFQPPRDIRYLYTNRDLGVVECWAKNVPIRLFVVSSEERSWIDIAIGEKLWSTEEPVVYTKENQFGYFPNVGATPIELLVDLKKAPVGLIFRVSAQDPNQNKQETSNLSRLFVLGIDKEEVCFLGLTNSNSTARLLVQTKAICRQRLQSRVFKPK